MIATLAIPLPARAKEAEQDVVFATDAGTTSILMPGTGRAVTLPRDLGVTVRGPLPAGTEIGIFYEPSMYELNTQARVAKGPKEMALKLTSVSPGRITITLLRPAPAGLLTLIAGHMTLSRYPHDIMRDARELEVVKDRKTRRPEKTQGPSDSPGSVANLQPWGAECGALWEKVTWGSANHYYWPAQISVRSTGPGPIPAGSTVRIHCDPRILQTMNVRGAVDRGGSPVAGSTMGSLDGGARALAWTSGVLIPAGHQISLSIGAVVSLPPGDLETVKFPIVDFFGPEPALSAQRTTYLESIRRSDVVTNAESRRDFRIFSGQGEED